MAWTQADIDRLKKALGQGATRVRFADREVTYRSLNELREILSMAQREIDEQAGIRRRQTRQVRFATGKGLS